MAPEEATFRAYTQKQGENYAAGRPGYSPNLFKAIIDRHTATGGHLDTVVDVGCGTGQATRDLGAYFSHAIGIDPSAGMIDIARAAAGKETTDKQQQRTKEIRFEVSSGESIGSDLKPPIAEGSVDLLAVATAAHWFDLDRFWPRAAQVLKPGGTAALWARTAMTVDPNRTPNGKAIRALVDDVFNTQLDPFQKLGSRLTSGLYVDLPLPWTLKNPVKEFDEKTFYRKVWNENRDSKDIDGVGTEVEISPEGFESFTSTNSTVTRWREANPDKAGTDEDILKKMTKQIKELLHEAGVKPGEEVLIGQVSIVLLVLKRQ